MCAISPKHVLHAIYLHIVSYFIPFIVIILIYIIILRQSIQSSSKLSHLHRQSKRNTNFVRNILIICILFLLSQLPGTILIKLSDEYLSNCKVLYMFAVVATLLSTCFEKVLVIICHPDIRIEFQKQWKRLYQFLRLHSNRIEPLTLSNINV
ncbi:hypothetical protein I4U23_028156 [Adineta vaga]|nr:hypothetical protein I4U23_028156 [Adineta vaga]